MWWSKKSDKKEHYQEGHCTYLGKGLDFTGQAHLEGIVRVDGQISGDLHTTDTLIIGEQAVVHGSLFGKVIITSGKVIGNISATERVQLCSPALIVGDIMAPTFSVEEGVQFRGLSSIGIPLNEEKKIDLNLSQPQPDEPTSVFQELGLIGKVSDAPEWLPNPSRQEVA